MNKNMLKKIMEEETKENRVELLEKSFRKKLKELRLEDQLTQKQIAKKLNIAESTYANWEQGRTRPGIYDIFSLLWVFDINAGELFDITGIGQEEKQEEQEEEK